MSNVPNPMCTVCLNWFKKLTAQILEVEVHIEIQARSTVKLSSSEISAAELIFSLKVTSPPPFFFDSVIVKSPAFTLISLADWRPNVCFVQTVA